MTAARKSSATKTYSAGFIEAMDCLPVSKIPEGPQWTYEIKLESPGGCEGEGQGESVAGAADCLSCHTQPGGKAFEGSDELKTVFGIIYGPNITPDPRTGIKSAYSDKSFGRGQLAEYSRSNADSYDLNECPGNLVRQLKETWAVVLAGGEDSRLRPITTTRQGIVVPKQYCSLERSSCLLQDALARARAVAMPSHVCTVVAAKHRQWWGSAVGDLNESNVFVQPQNRGTAFGLLLALLTLERRNPEARLIVLPADHYFRDEEPVTRAMRMAANLADENESSIYLLGADPDGPDAELGYILPKQREIDRPAPIAGFTEKPNEGFARELISLGALWYLFILAGSVKALVQLFMDEHADTVAEMREALKSSAAGRCHARDEFYDRLEPLDFARDVLEVQTHRLQVIRVQHCGWTDLGTPKRVAATVRSISRGTGERRERRALSAPLFFDLGSQYS